MVLAYVFPQYFIHNLADYIIVPYFVRVHPAKHLGDRNCVSFFQYVLLSTSYVSDTVLINVYIPACTAELDTIKVLSN